MMERVRRALHFTFDDEPDGATEDVADYTGRRKYCRECGRILPREKGGTE